MELYPAIDLREGRCVRLHQGDFDRETVYGEDPVAQAISFAEQGAAWIHVVDLDGARTGEAANRVAIGRIAEAVDIPVQAGGGIRDVEAVEELVDAGVARVVLGTVAVEQPELVAELASSFPVAVGLDARGRQVAVRGWERGSGHDLLDLVHRFSGDGVSAFVVTEIGRDGTMEGPDVSGLAEVLGSTGVEVIASGGVGSLDDLESLANLEVAGKRLAGAIVGRALYEGRFTVSEALDRLADAEGTTRA